MIFFLYGEDTYRSREKLKQIEEKFKKTDKNRVNLVKVDGEHSTWKNIEREILSPSFLYDKKLVVVENFLKKKGQKFDEAVEFIGGNRVPMGTVVVFWEKGMPDQRTAIFNLLNKPKCAQKFDFLIVPKLEQWIRQEVKNEGIEIEKNAVRLLVDLVGPDLWQMSAEIKKLVAYSRGRTSEGRAVICDGDVSLLVRGKFDENIFALTDALGNKNKKLVFKILEEQIGAGQRESYIFSMLARQFRILLQIKEIIENEYFFISSNDPTIRQKVAAELSLHPYVVSKALYQIKNYSLEELKNIYSKILALDMKMKRTNIKPRLLLDLFMAEVCFGK